MDMRVYLAVLKRHPLILGAGILFAFFVAAYMCFSISLSPLGVSWKLTPTYSASSQILVSQSGFPLGRVSVPAAALSSNSSSGLDAQFADPSRFDYLAGLYAQIADSDLVLHSVVGKNGYVGSNGVLHLDGGKTSGTYSATALIDPNSQSALPFVEIDSVASTRDQAIEIGQRATSALYNYIIDKQNAAKIPSDQRAVLSVVRPPNLAREIKGRRIVVPIIAFLLCLFGTILIIFFKDNLSKPNADAVRDDTWGAPTAESESRPPEVGGTTELRSGIRARG
jgi:capsular polysaccharide biosynthesis protein